MPTRMTVRSLGGIRAHTYICQEQIGETVMHDLMRIRYDHLPDDWISEDIEYITQNEFNENAQDEDSFHIICNPEGGFEVVDVYMDMYEGGGDRCFPAGVIY